MDKHTSKGIWEVNKALATAPCMAYFDMAKDTYVTVDAIPVEVFAVLSQMSPGKMAVKWLHMQLELNEGRYVI